MGAFGCERRVVGLCCGGSCVPRGEVGHLVGIGLPKGRPGRETLHVGVTCRIPFEPIELMDLSEDVSHQEVGHGELSGCEPLLVGQNRFHPIEPGL